MKFPIRIKPPNGYKRIRLGQKLAQDSLYHEFMGDGWITLTGCEGHRLRPCDTYKTIYAIKII